MELSDFESKYYPAWAGKILFIQWKFFPILGRDFTNGVTRTLNRLSSKISIDIVNDVECSKIRVK
jgi:hypothetical protein